AKARVPIDLRKIAVVSEAMRVRKTHDERSGVGAAPQAEGTFGPGGGSIAVPDGGLGVAGLPVLLVVLKRATKIARFRIFRIDAQDLAAQGQAVFVPLEIAEHPNAGQHHVYAVGLALQEFTRDFFGAVRVVRP